MKKLFFLCGILLPVFSISYGQKPEVIIEEDYSNPKSYMVYKGMFADENPVENGMYSPKPSKNLATSMSFQPELKDLQKGFNEWSDIEFTIVKLKGNDEGDFAIVRIKPERGYSDDYDLEMDFKFNQLGTCYLDRFETNAGIKSVGYSKIKVNTGNLPNVVRVEHRKDSLRYFINNQLAIAYKFERNKRINWDKCSVLYSKDSKQRLALDKVIFKGYMTPDDIARKQAELENQKAKEQASKYAAMGLPTEIKSKTHTLNAYAGWAGIFPNSGKYADLRSDYGNKKPAEIFNEAPEGWIKDESHLYSLNFMFYETDSSSLQTAKGWFIDLAKNRTGWAAEKIKPLEEQMVLPDGRKALLLFYVCPDTKGMVGGHYFNCDLYIEAANDKTKIISYNIFIEGGNPPLPENEAAAWKDYFKKVLLTIRPN